VERVRPDANGRADTLTNKWAVDDGGDVGDRIEQQAWPSSIQKQPDLSAQTRSNRSLVLPSDRLYSRTPSAHNIHGLAWWGCAQPSILFLPTPWRHRGCRLPLAVWSETGVEEKQRVWRVERTSGLRQSDSISSASADCCYSHSSLHLLPSARTR